MASPEIGRSASSGTAMNPWGSRLSAAALAGGQSRRMGTDKALLPLVAGGQPMLGLVIDRLSAVADDVLIVASEPRNYDVLVPLIPGESRQRGYGLVFQTLHAIYSKRCLPFIEKRISEGRKQVVGFFDDVRVRTLHVDEITRWDPDLWSFFNANTPETLLVAAQINAQAERDAD